MRWLTLTGMAAWFGVASAFGQAPSEIQFETSHADVRLANGRWLLMADDRIIKDLGPNENDARDALQLVRNFQLNQYGVIGTPRPVLEYWLTDGHAPRGLAFALQRMAFDAASLRVEAWQGQWCLRDARQVLFVFGPHEADARQALAVLCRYGFNQIAYVGQAAPVMMCFLNDPDQLPPPLSPVTPSAPNDPWGMQGPAASVMPPGMMAVRQLSGANPLPMGVLQGGDCRPIDWQQVTMQQDGQGWKLLAGTQCLADFGPRQEDGLIGLSAVRYYRFTEMVSVGEGPSAFTFYLSDGQPPHGLLPGVQTMPFQPEALTAKLVGGTWMICQDGRPLFDGGTTVEQANAVIQIMQNFHFDTWCQVGEDGRGMRFPIQRW